MDEPLLDRRYQLWEAIGSGGEARVFKARDLVEEREVAVRMPIRLVDYQVPATVPEPHRGWVRLLGGGTDPARGGYQVLELLAGPSLAEQVAAGPLEAEAWRAFVEESLDAVGALHGAGWVHGDLNAANFLHAGSPEARWKMLELPFLRFEPPTGRTALFGSIFTLAPEQFNGVAANVATDLYALGCLYYYAASGQFPHTGGSSTQIAIERLRFPAEPLAEKAPALPSAWCAGVMTLLEREPQKRFPSAEAARHLLRVA